MPFASRFGRCRIEPASRVTGLGLITAAGPRLWLGKDGRTMTKWEYLTLILEYDKKLKDWRVQGAERPPGAGMQAILNGYGSQGWELVSLQMDDFGTYAGLGGWSSEPRTYRATFKRALLG
jgi:hypothetical protein